MAQYIDKAAVVAEIKERIDRDNERAAFYSSNSEHDYFYRVKEKVYKSLLSFLDTLEVKGVDLRNELKEDWLFADKTEVDCLECMCLTEDMFVSLAKKYFELGLKARKGE